MDQAEIEAHQGPRRSLVFIVIPEHIGWRGVVRSKRCPAILDRIDPGIEIINDRVQNLPHGQRLR